MAINLRKVAGNAVSEKYLGDTSILKTIPNDLFRFYSSWYDSSLA